MRIGARRIELGILLQQDGQYAFDAVVAHGLVVGRPLPFHLHHEETVLSRHLDEAGRLGLGAGVVLVAVQEHHYGYAVLRSALEQFLGPVFVP